MKKFLLMAMLAVFGMAAIPAYAADDEDVVVIEKKNDDDREDGEQDDDCDQ